MNTTTANPEAPATGHFEPRSRTGSRYQSGPERSALRRPSHDRMLTRVAAGLAEYLGLDVTVVRIVGAFIESGPSRSR